MKKQNIIKRKVSIILFYDNNGNILIQDRREISKHGEEYGFFGGHIEEGETPEQTLRREVKEELNFNIKNFKFFKRQRSIIKELNRDVTRWMYIAPMPDLNNLKVNEGKPVIMKFTETFNLKMAPGDTDLLKEIYEYLNKK